MEAVTDIYTRTKLLRLPGKHKHKHKMADKFEGWTVVGEDSVKGNLKWQEYQVKDFQEDDVERESLH